MVTDTYALSSYRRRPDQEHFFTVPELLNHVAARKKNSIEHTLPLDAIEAVPDEGVLKVSIPSESTPIALNHLTAQQLCQRAGITTRFLDQVSPETAALAINESLRRKDDNPLDVVLRTSHLDRQTHSLVSTQYNPAWDAEVVERLAMPLVEKGWMVPPYRSWLEHPQARPARADEVLPRVDSDRWGGTVEPGELIEPKGASASDRNMFLFMVHPEQVVDTQDIMGRKVFRGITISHSETGHGALAVQGFVFDFVCGNYMMWGSRRVFSLRMTHRGRDGSGLFIDKAVARMRYAERNLRRTQENSTALARAASTVLLSSDPTKREAEVQMMLLQARLRGVFSTAFIRDAIKLTRFDRYGDERSLWAVASGLTERAQEHTRYAEHRAVYDRAAARLMEWGVANG